jgi:RNA polymerase sigma-70 factor (ECF subfamily)
MPDANSVSELLLKNARAGDVAARGLLLEEYRHYLRLLARTLIGGALQARLDASDLVQETFLKAHRDFDAFAGGGEPELAAWLRQILLRNLADQARIHRSKGRDYRRQESLEAILDRSSIAARHAMASPVSSPSARAAGREQAVLLANALDRLPANYREVFILRNLEHVPVDQIAARMNRSVNAIHKLWARALAALRAELEDES